jgi:glycosyltransferase involved in cell wall biosynthesis
MTTPRLIVVGPLPPPVHGVTVSTSLVLRNPLLCERFRVEHLDTSDHRSAANIGRWDLRNVGGALSALARLAAATRGEKGIVYLPLSQSTAGFLRDSLLVLVAGAMRWRVAAHLRGSELRQLYAGSRPLVRRWMRFTLGRLDSFAVMGESLRSVVAGLVPADRVAVVPNGTPEPRVDGVTIDPYHVLFLSNLRRRKGIVEAVRTALLVLERVPRARFTFAGAWESADVEREVRSLASAANGQVTFLGRVEGEEKEQLLASAAVLLFPPVEPEGHPRVVLEALAAGVPVVATDRGAIQETVLDGEAGFVLAEPRPEDLERRVTQLLLDRPLQRRQSRAARSRYLSLFSQERADARLAEWLIETLEAPSNGMHR